MDFSDLGNRFVLAVEDLSGVWAPIHEHLKRRLPLRQVTFKNKFGVQTNVDELPMQFLSSADPRLQKLRQFAHSPVTWFRNPFVQLVLVSCEEGEEYKRAYRLQLKALAEAEGRLGVAPELIFVYLRPASADALARGPAKVFDSMRRDLNLKRRDRCVRLDPAPAEAQQAAGGLLGLEELERSLKEAIKASFEARTAAYDEEVRRLMLSRQQDPAWSFPTLFLFKDSLAVMMEAGGLLDDALREYYELEAVYLEAIQAGQLARQGFGGKAPDADEAALMWQSWHGIRQAVLQGDSVPEFAFRQFLFASQARVLLKQHRLVEVAERGLGFIQMFSAILDQKEREGQIPARFSAAWAFAAALSLAGALSTLQAQRAEHRRSDAGRALSGQSRWKSARQQPAGGGSSRPPSPGFGPPSPLSSPTSSHHPGGPGSAALRSSRPPSEAPALSPGSGSAATTPVNGAAGGGAAPGQGGFDGKVDWGLGALPGDSEAWDLQARGHRKGDSTSILYCLLGHLYSNARSELMQLGEDLGLSPPQPGGAEALAAAMGGSSLPPAPTPRPTSAARNISAGRTHSLFPPRQQPSLPLPGTSEAAPGASGPLPAHTNSSLTDTSSEQGYPAGTAAGGGEGPAGPRLQAVDLGYKQQQQQQQGSEGAGGAPGVPPLDLSASGAGAGAGAEPGSAAAAAGEGEQGPSVVVGHARGASVVSNLSQEGGGFGGGGGADSARSLGGREDAGGGGSGSGMLRRLSVRTRAPMETESQASTPKSSISQVSSSPTRAAQWEAQQAQQAQQAAAASAAAAGGELADVRAIERQVMSPAASVAHLDSPPKAAPTSLSQLAEGSLAPLAVAAAAGAPGELPPWLVHWRLRLGLASEDLFCDLWRALSEAAARCYSQCGRRRHAALLHADVADMLMWRGDLAGAAELYYAQCRLALREGWYGLAAQTLPKLAACQMAGGGGGGGALALTAATMLAVPLQHRLEGADAATACQLLLSAAAAAAAEGGGLPLARPLLGQMEVGGALALPHLLSAHPPQSLSSRFFGVTSSAGAPVLTPPAADAAQQAQRGGALLAAVGDVAVLTLHVVSAVPVDLPLSGAVLTLGVMQQLTVLAAPRKLSNPPPSTPAPAPPSALARVSATSAAAAGPEGTPRGAATPARRSLGAAPATAAAAGGSSEGEAGSKFESKWQEVEELQCRLISISPLAAARAAGSAGAQQAGVLRPGTNVLTFLASPVKRGVYVPKHIRGFLRLLPLHIDVHPPPSLLWPCTPPPAGEGGWAMAAAGAAAQPLHLSPGSRPRRSSTTLDTGGGGGGGGLHGFGPAGESPLAGRGEAGWGDAALQLEQTPEDSVVMVVDSARPRVALWPSAAGGAVVAGQKQWLGLVVCPDRDRLQGASLALTWPGVGGAALGRAGSTALAVSAGSSFLARRTVTQGSLGGAFQHTTHQVSAVVSVAGQASPFKQASNLGPHRSTISLGGAADLMAARSGRLDAAGPGATLAPLGNGAVALPFDPQQGDSSAGAAGSGAHVGDVLAAEDGGPGGPNWLLGDFQEQQQFRLPQWVTERPGCSVWWWVEAGAYTTPPEVVRIAPPQAHSHAPHFLPGDAPLPSALPPHLDLAVNLEYDSGCHRSHSRALTVPVLQPFSAHVAARELPGGAVAVQAVLQSNLAVPLLLTGCSLAPQPGMVLRDSMAQRMGLLPLRLPAGASATLSFLIQLSDGLTGGAAAGGGGRFDRAAAAAKLAQGAKLQPSVLSVDYEVDSRQLCSAPAPALALPTNPGEAPLGGSGGSEARAGAAAHALPAAPLTGSMATLGPAPPAYGTAGAAPPCCPSLEALHKLEEHALAASEAVEEEGGSSRGSSPTRRGTFAGGEAGGDASSPTRRRSYAGGEGNASPVRQATQGWGEAGRREIQRCGFTQLLVLQLAPPEDDAQGALVLLRLLGPFTAVAGQPVTLCWRLERSTAGAAAGGAAATTAAQEEPVPLGTQPEAVPLQYEVVAEGDSWRPLGRRSGRVSLGSAPGSVATIEATWVPLLHGTLPVPALKLQEIRYQELFDVGNENNFIRVLPDGRGLSPTL